MKSVVGWIVLRHDFDHESFHRLQDSGLIWGGVHFGDVRVAMGATRPPDKRWRLDRVKNDVGLPPKTSLTIPFSVSSRSQRTLLLLSVVACVQICSVLAKSTALGDNIDKTAQVQG